MTKQDKSKYTPVVARMAYVSVFQETLPARGGQCLCHAKAKVRQRTFCSRLPASRCRGPEG